MENILLLKQLSMHFNGYRLINLDLDIIQMALPLSAASQSPKQH